MLKKKCVVIGGGITGMSAAIMLTTQGYHTTIIEGSSELAPLLRGFDCSGWHFDTGFHYAQCLERGGALRNWLNSLSIDIDCENCRNVTELTGTETGIFCIPKGIDEVEVTWPQAVENYKKYCNDSKELFKSSPFLTANSAGTFSPFSLTKVPLLEYMSSLNIPCELKSSLLGRCVLYGVPPRKAAKDDFFFVSGYGEPGRTLNGGGLSLANAFVKRINELGIDVFCGKPVTEIVSSHRRVVGVDNGTYIPADLVIYTGNPTELQKLLPDSGLRPAWFRHLELMEKTPEPVVVYGICGSSVPELHSWYFTDGSYDFNMLEHTKPTICVITGEADSRGWKTCMIMAFSRNNGEKQNLEKIAMENIPTLKDCWQCFGAYGGNAMRKFIYGADGSVFGYAHTYDTMPVLPVARLHGLFLAGQSIQLPGILGCIVSAAIAVSLIAGQEAVLKRFRRCVGE